MLAQNENHEIFSRDRLFVLCLVICHAERGATEAMTTLTPELWNKILLTSISSLSAFGSVAVIVTYFLWTDLQTTSRRILLYISVGDFFTVYPALVILWSKDYTRNNFSCKLQSFVSTTAVMWSFFWTCSLAIYLYVALVRKCPGIAEKLMVIFHPLNWIVPAIFLGTAWYEDMLGYTDNKSTVGWCWVVIKKGQHEKAVIWMLVCGKLWEMISYLINGVLYISVTRSIKQEVSARIDLISSQSVQIAEKGRRKLAFVPVVFVVLRIWGTLRFLLFAFEANVPYPLNEALMSLQTIGDNSQGIANFVLFCVLTEKFKRNFSRLCHCAVRDRADQHQYHGHGGTFSC